MILRLLVILLAIAGAVIMDITTPDWLDLLGGLMVGLALAGAFRLGRPEVKR